MTEEKRLQRIKTCLGSICREVIAIDEQETMAAVAQWFFEYGTTISEQVEVEQETYCAPRGKRILKKMQYRENDIKALKKVIGERGQIIKMQRGRRKTLQRAMKDIAGQMREDGLHAWADTIEQAVSGIVWNPKIANSKACQEPTHD